MPPKRTTEQANTGEDEVPLFLGGGGLLDSESDLENDNAASTSSSAKGSLKPTEIRETLDSTRRGIAVPPQTLLDAIRSNSDEDEDEDEGADGDGEVELDDCNSFDPVIRAYEVYLCSELREYLYLFQYPVRPKDKPYRSSRLSCPIEARFKSNAGEVEVDIPVNTAVNYDQEKGRQWGEVLRKEKVMKKALGKKTKVKDEDVNDGVIDVDFKQAVKNGLVFDKQTLGSRIQPDGPKYMAGVFRGDQIHLTPMKSTLQLRPQFNHVDSQVAQDRADRRGGEEIEVSKAGITKAVHVSVKSIDDPASQLSATMKAIRKSEGDIWTSCHWVDQDDEKSWDEFALLAAREPEGQPALTASMGAKDYMDWLSGVKEASMRY